MIESLSIKNFQSHRDTTIELSPFTVLVGPSSSGKSAIVRAVSALTSNPTGKDYITHGEATCQISAKTDKGIVTLTKGKPEDSYVILADEDINNPRRYTKLGREVPSDVTGFLGIAPRDAINYAGQFDMPYLLKSSPAEVARTLGELTNVSVVFEAAREGTRRRNEKSSTLKVRKADLEALTPRLDAAESHEKRLTHQDAAESAYARAVALQERQEGLNALLLRLQTASAALKAHTEREIVIPDTSRAELLLNRLENLDSCIRRLAEAKKTISLMTETISEETEKITGYAANYEELLTEAGTCPVCGQDTSHIHTQG